jgi:opacity protein-like surface antigen
MKRLFLLALLLLPLAAPAAMADVNFAPAAEDRRAKQALPPPGKALIFVFRENGAAQRTDVPLFLDGEQIGMTVPRSYYLWAVDPGKHTIAAKPDRRVALQVTVQAGRNYFIEHQLAADSDRVSLRQVTYAQGRVAVNRCRLIEDGSRAAAIALGKPAPKPAAKPRAPAAAPAQRAGLAFMLKTGFLSLSKTSQTIQTTDGLTFATEFDDRTSTPLALEGEWRTTDGFAFGGEFIRYSNKLTANNVGGEMDVTTVLFNAKKYFTASNIIYPYLGVGIGLASTDFSGAFSGSTGGVAYQAMGGVEFRWQQFGVYTELKFLGARTEDDAGNEVDAGSRGVLVGVSARF